MNLFASTLAVTLALLPVAAYASWFEFCDLEGKVQRSELAGKDGCNLEVLVLDARRASERGKLSYTDCSEHRGKVISVSMQIPAEAGIPAPGDVVRFSRSSVDEFRKDGSFAGNEVTVRFQTIQKVQR